MKQTRSYHSSSLGRSSVNPSDAGVPNVSFAINESSDSDEGSPFSSQPTTTTSGMINDRIFVRPSSSSSRRYRHQPLPRLSLLRSSGHDSAANTYGSVQDSPATSFTAPRPEDFSEDLSSDNLAQTANLVIEDTSDMDSVDNDDSEHMHSVISSSGTNPTYVDDDDDDETTPNVVSTNL